MTADASIPLLSSGSHGRSVERIHDLFIEPGLLIKNSGAAPEISNVRQFIEPRQASVDSGELTRFHEAELSAKTEVFGNVAHRFGGYIKSGDIEGCGIRGQGIDLDAIRSYESRLENELDGLGR